MGRVDVSCVFGSVMIVCVPFAFHLIFSFLLLFSLAEVIQNEFDLSALVLDTPTR